MQTYIYIYWDQSYDQNGVFQKHRLNEYHDNKNKPKKDKVVKKTIPVARSNINRDIKTAVLSNTVHLDSI